MTTVLKINLKDLDSQVIKEIQSKFGMSGEVEIRVPDESAPGTLFPESTFWEVIDSVDWLKNTMEEKLLPAIIMLSEMPVSNIYLFADKVSEKLFLLDTKAHAQAYAAKETNRPISADDFLYARCAVIAEGKEYFDKVFDDPSQMPDDIVFEPLLSLAELAYERKTGEEFNYIPVFNYESFSNKRGWS